MSLYDTAPLKATLERLVDFDLLNRGPTRVSVLAVDVESGNLEVFDSARQRLGPEHILASGALPPGFPPVRIGLRWFWDGGLLSNTPLSLVLDDEPRRDTLVFQVDLWSAKGAMPRHLLDAQERAKDIQYSSRTRQITDRLRTEHEERELLKRLIELIPPERREHDATCRELQRRLQVARVAVLHLIYQDKEWDGLAKDYEFGALTMRNHWDSGLEDVRRTLAHQDWLQLPPEHQPFVTHDVHRRRSEGG
ncbi:DUF3734 domain-containing protein [Aquabacterium sp. J223]|nr:DUF3734 domain-containing protein [Aquabacterium sp. J223]UUX96565.1 DUF3734 domain-containing protein [Aquabacterium sp. J223]